jgi:drug/metabolite transporter (DMT)-like permease
MSLHKATSGSQKPVTSVSSSDKSTGYAALFATVIIWSVPSLFQFYLNRYYDPWAQNFYRYSIACLAIAPFLVLRSQQPTTRLTPRLFLLCLWACLPNVVHQVGQVLALYYMGPGVYAIFGRTSVIFTALLALAFFPEERFVIRQWQFQVGTLLGLAGAFGVLWFQAGAHSEHISVPGVLIAIIATFCWALYGVLIKRPSAQLGSIRSFAVVSIVTSVLLLPLTAAFGHLATPLDVTARVNVILIVSAVSCITLAHVLYYVAIRELGVALAQTLQLLCPVGALGLSAWIFRERLVSAQLWSAAVLLAGAFLAMKTKPVTVAESAENL